MIKNKLTDILAEQDRTLNELSKLTGIRYATLWNFARNITQKAYYEMMSQICRVLKCRPGDILKYIPDKETKD